MTYKLTRVADPKTDSFDTAQAGINLLVVCCVTPNEVFKVRGFAILAHPSVEDKILAHPNEPYCKELQAQL
jgi:hypothetical protein